MQCRFSDRRATPGTQSRTRLAASKPSEEYFSKMPIACARVVGGGADCADPAGCARHRWKLSDASKGGISRSKVPASAPTTVGDAANVIASGSRLIVRSGQARITLNGGGEIIICGAARLQLLKSQDAMTIALDLGTFASMLNTRASFLIHAIGDGNDNCDWRRCA